MRPFLSSAMNVVLSMTEGDSTFFCLYPGCEFSCSTYVEYAAHISGCGYGK